MQDMQDNAGLNFPGRYTYEKFFDNQTYDETLLHFVNYLAPYGQVFRYGRGSTVDNIKRGDILVVLRGMLNTQLVAQNGEKLSLYRLERGNIEGESEYFIRNDALTLLEVISPAELSIVPGIVVEQRLEQDRQLYHCLLQSVIRKRNLLFFAVSDICFNDAIGRLASFLLRQTYLGRVQYRASGSDPGYYIGSFTHEEMASRLQLNRVTVTRMLSELREENLIAVQGRKIFVTNPSRLQEKVNLLAMPKRRDF